MSSKMRPNSYHIEGDTAYLHLTQGQDALVDVADLPRVLTKRWQASWSKQAKDYYVRSRTGGTEVALHRFLTEAPVGVQAYFLNGNSLDNRRANLGLVSRSEAMSRSQAKGVATRYRPLRIEGDIAYIPLINGQEAMIDAADVPLVENRNWSLQPRPNNAGYVFGHWREGDPEALRAVNRSLSLHRLLMQPPKGKVVDHINHDTMDNRRSNLRVVSNRDNSFNRKDRPNKTGYRGVSTQTTKTGLQYYVARVTVVKTFPHTEEGLRLAGAEAKRLQRLLKDVDLWEKD